MIGDSIELGNRPRGRSGVNHLVLGAVASLIAGCATGIGAIPVLFFRSRTFSHRLKDLFLGFAAGVILAATAFSLLGISLVVGFIVMTALDNLLG